MIGGVDRTYPLPVTKVIEAVRELWPTYMREICEDEHFVYADQDTMYEVEQEGVTDAAAPKYLHLLVEGGETTVVANTPDHPIYDLLDKLLQVSRSVP